MPDEALLFALQQRIAGVTAYIDQTPYLERLTVRFREPLSASEGALVQGWVLREGRNWLLEGSGLHYPTMRLVTVSFVRSPC